ncbi:nucleotidyltransferase domain-containing protein [Ectothiorhodospira sp. 9100]|nr:nucleotidyltransferase domain-containing protein [Ectothiorhodospira sp. 9100]MCG5519262.1 nucleotidyltransferase domain-containing protein [Ectothiorhodospira sp. 9905]
MGLDEGADVKLLSPWPEAMIKTHPVVFSPMNHIDHRTEEAVRRFLALISSRYDVARAIVYGSRARGTHRPDSDADVAVLLRGEHQRFLPTKLDMADIAFDVLLETGILISPLPIWLDEWEHPENYSNPILLRNIDREGVRL